MAGTGSQGCRFLLAGLLALMLLFPVLEDLTRPTLLIAVIAVVFVAGVIGVHPGRPRVRRALLLAVLQVGLTALAAAAPAGAAYEGVVLAGLAVTTALIVYAISCVFRYVLQAVSITHDQIYAGISVYLMIGFAFGSVYYLLDALEPGCFGASGAPAANHTPDLMYFSFVTLATLGYGDVTPIAKVARALAELEAVAGTLYMAIFMARLVSLYPAPEKRTRI